MGKLGEDCIEILGISRIFPLHSKSFKQVQIRDTLILPKEKPDIESIFRVTTSVNIIDKYIILTPRATSNGLKSLTGKKVVVEGEVAQKIEYGAREVKKSICTAQLMKIFSSYIVLDETFDIDCNLEIIPYVEDVCVKKLDKRRVFNNIMLLLDAKSFSSI